MLTFKKVNAAIQEKFPHVILVQGEGYIYISSEDDETLEKICGLWTSSIPICKLNHDTIEGWIYNVTELFENKEGIEYVGDYLD
jgi:hypothetical protein